MPRRTRRRTLVATIIGLSLALPAVVASAQDAPAQRDVEPSKKLGWRLGAQCWTFRDRSVYETIETVKALQLRYIEMFPGQKLSASEPTKFDHNSPPEQRALIKQKLKDEGIIAMNYGVVDIPQDEAAARKVFDFAKDMGIQTICSEPKPEAMDTVEKMAKEYDIKVAIHNHPTPSRYWDPKTVADAVKDRDPRVGCCADIGHWVRSGIKPVDAMKVVEGRIHNFHFKDLSEFGKKQAIDIPWGTGVSDVRAVLEEAKRQNYKGTIMVEYEHGKGPELVENVRKCIEWYDKTTKELAGE